MSGVLQRLVGRATGQVSEGLQPRLPARFESGTREFGLNELHTEENPLPAPAVASEPEVPAPHSRRASPPAINSPPEPIHPSAAPAQVTFPSMTEVHVAGQSIDQTPPPPGLAAAAPAPLLPQITAMQTFFAEAPHREPPEQTPRVSSHALNAETPPPGRPDAPRSPPEPLLPADAAASLIEAPATAHSTPQTDAPAPAMPDSAEPPEITIHIGRLDIRTEAPKPSPPKRQATQPRAMPSLSDYLRGSGK